MTEVRLPRWRATLRGLIGPGLCALTLILLAFGPGGASGPDPGSAPSRDGRSSKGPAGPPHRHWLKEGGQGPIDAALRPEDYGPRSGPVRQIEPSSPLNLAGPIPRRECFAPRLVATSLARADRSQPSLQILLCVWRT